MTVLSKHDEADGDRDRLRALDRYKVLDTAPQEEFDDIFALAAQICDMPVALIRSTKAASRFDHGTKFCQHVAKLGMRSRS